MSYWSGCDANAAAGAKMTWISSIAALGSERSPDPARLIVSTSIQITPICELRLLVRSRSRLCDDRRADH